MVMEMAWSPTKTSRKKRAGSIICLSESKLEDVQGSQEFFKRAYQQDQDLNEAPEEEMAQEVSPSEVIRLQELRVKNEDTNNIAYRSDGTLDLLPPNRQKMAQDEQEESTPSQNWALENHGTSIMSVELHTPFPEGRDE